MSKGLPHRMLVVHNDSGSRGRVHVIEPVAFRRYAFGSLLAYADDVYKQIFRRQALLCHSLTLPGAVPVYDSAHLQDVAPTEKFDSILCHLVLDHGGVITDAFLSKLRAEFLEPDGLLMNPVKSIAKNDVARASRFALETQTAPCIIKKDDNYNTPETVLQISTQEELDAWRARTPAEEQRRSVIHKPLKYYASEGSRMHQLERWIVLFEDLTVNHRASNEFYIKTATSLSYFVRDERRMADDLERLAGTGYSWRGRSIDCAYDNDSEAWDARYAALAACRSAFGFHYAELDVLRPSKHEFVVIDVNQTPGPSYRNVYFRELAVRFLADGLGIRPFVAEPKLRPAAPESSPAEKPRDASLLEEELARDPNNPEARFQLGEAYRDAGKLEQALESYRMRAEMEGGSDEERFVSALEAGRICMRLQANESVVLSMFLGAYLLRPSRAEPLYELARYHRLKTNYPMATLFAKAGVEMPRPPDRLSVVESIYTWQLLDELGTAAHLADDHACAKRAWETLLGRAQSGVSIPPDDLRRIRENLAQASRGRDGRISAPEAVIH